MSAKPRRTSRPSWLCEEIDERVGAFLERPPEGDWPYLWIDATYVKVRQAGRILSVATIIAVAVNGEGRREVLGMATGPSEAEPFWTAFLRCLTRRGLRGVKLVISDAHEGLKAAVAKVLKASWQRCRARSIDLQLLPWRRPGAAQARRHAARDPAFYRGRSQDHPSLSALADSPGVATGRRRARIDMQSAIRGVWPFLVAETVVLGLLIASQSVVSALLAEVARSRVDDAKREARLAGVAGVGAVPPDSDTRTSP